MKIGVVSDTHGHMDILKRAALQLVNTLKVDAIIHLGDDSKDAEILNSFPIDIYWVPGIYEARYGNKDIEKRQIVEFENIPFLLTHTPTRVSQDTENTIDPLEAIEDGDVKVVLHGHTHKWRIDEERGVIIVNPGHLTPKNSSSSKGFEPSFGFMEVTHRKIDIKIIGLNGEVFSEKMFFFES